jgi:hypothetical protein
MSKAFMDDKVSHISLEDDAGNAIAPKDHSKSNCFSTWALPRKGDKVQIEGQKGEWEVLDVIHTMSVGSPVPVILRLKEVSSKLGED